MQLGDGTRWYLTGPPAWYGPLADLVPVPDAAAFPVPVGLAAAVGVAGLAGWVALGYRGHLQAGATVLVLGAAARRASWRCNPLGSWAPAGLPGLPVRRTSGKPLTAAPTRSRTSRKTGPSTPAWPPRRPAATT